MTKLTITSKIPCAVRIGDTLAVAVTTHIHNGHIEEPGEKKRVILQIMPLDCIHIPYIVVLDINKDGRYYVDSAFGTLNYHPERGYNLELKDIKKRYMQHAKLLSECAYNPKNQSQKPDTFSVINDSYTQLLIEHNGSITRIYLPDFLENIRTKAETVGTKIIFALTATTGAKQYLLVAARGDTDSEYQIKIDCVADKIEQADSKTMVLSSLNDLAGRALVKVYDSAGFDSLDEYFVFLNGTPKRVTDPALVSVALFEAVKCDDLSEAKSYITQDLLSTIKIEELTEFLFDYVSIEPYSSDGNIYSYNLTDSFGNTFTYEFTIQNGLVDNIRQAD